VRPTRRPAKSALKYAAGAKFHLDLDGFALFGKALFAEIE
jgi:hypothetical protein